MAKSRSLMNAAKNVFNASEDAINPALKKVRQSLDAKKAVSGVDDALRASRNNLTPIRDFIDDNLIGNPSSKGVNRTMSSEATFNKVFKSPESIAQQEKIYSSKKDDIENIVFKNRQATRINNNNKRMAAKNQTDDVINLKRRTESNDVYNEAIKRGFDPGADDFERTVREIESERATLRERAKKNNNSPQEEGAASRTSIPKESSPKVKDSSPGSAAIDGNNGKMDKFMRQAVPVGVGGGLVFSMFNRNGNMSNSELYGQTQPYGYQ